MHELSLCSALIDEVERVARQHNAHRASRILLTLGPLSGAEPALLQNAFPLAAAGTLAEGAELVIETGAVEIRCNRCGETATTQPNQLACPACGHWQTTLLRGDELLLSSVELIDDDIYPIPP